ncbi:MAG: hypothetical protein LAT57_08020 [Balneolales bacterium]|nr:hypothetical protein [Balneolales bacterium]
MNQSEYVVHLFHGWGCTSDIWKPLIRELRMHSVLKNADFVIYDRGYSSVESSSLFPEAFASDKKHMLFTHSMGHFFVPAGLWPHVSHWNMISGFLQFHDVGKEQSKRVLKRMIRSLESDPCQVLRQFHQNLFSPVEQLNSDGLVIKNFDISRLSNDLVTLDSAEFDKSCIVDSTNLSIFHGTEDRIVPLDHAVLVSEQLNASDPIFVNNGSHAILITDPVTIASEVEKQLNTSF